MQIRELIGRENTLRFPVVVFLEHIMPLLFPGFYYDIVPEAEIGSKKHGEADVMNRCIRIREDVYYGAVAGNGRDRMTIAHEIAHYILFVGCEVSFARVFDDTPVPTCQDPEWQAKALAGELMCPAHLVAPLSPAQIAGGCGVSLKAAKYQLSKC
jgi:Zn-dependent peptidase ImmA (M78 family)